MRGLGHGTANQQATQPPAQDNPAPPQTGLMNHQGTLHMPQASAHNQGVNTLPRQSHRPYDQGIVHTQAQTIVPSYPALHGQLLPGQVQLPLPVHLPQPAHYNQQPGLAQSMPQNPLYVGMSANPQPSVPYHAHSGVNLGSMLGPQPAMLNSGPRQITPNTIQRIPRAPTVQQSAQQPIYPHQVGSSIVPSDPRMSSASSTVSSRPSSHCCGPPPVVPHTVEPVDLSMASSSSQSSSIQSQAPSLRTSTESRTITVACNREVAQRLLDSHIIPQLQKKFQLNSVTFDGDAFVLVGVNQNALQGAAETIGKESGQSSAQWEWLDNIGQFTKYSSQHNQLIEQAFHQNKPSVDINFDNQIYTISLEKPFFQYLRGSQNRRTVRRAQAGEIDQTNIQHPGDVMWYWREDDGVFYPYTAEAARMIEATYRSCATSMVLVQGSNGRTYMLDFGKCIQYNEQSKWKRKIRRGSPNQHIQGAITGG